MKMAKRTLAVVLSLLMAFGMFPVVGSAKINTETIGAECWDGAGTIRYGLDLYKVEGDKSTALEQGSTLSPGDIVEVRVKLGTDFYCVGVTTQIFYETNYFVPYLNGAATEAKINDVFKSGFFTEYPDDVPVITFDSGETGTFYDTLSEGSGRAGCANRYTETAIWRANYPSFMRKGYVAGDNASVTKTTPLADEYATTGLIYFTYTVSTDNSFGDGRSMKIPYATYCSFRMQVKEGADTNGALTSIYVPLLAQRTSSAANVNNNKLSGTTSQQSEWAGDRPTWGQGVDVTDAEFEVKIGEAGPQHEHAYTSAVTTAPTCTTPGVMTYTCSCGDSYTEEIPIDSNAHSYGAWTNLNAVSHQRVCAYNAAHVEIIAHNWDDGSITTAATCSAPGVKTYTCADCGATKTEEIAQLAHTWDEGTVTTAATCSASGVMTYACTVCGSTRSEEIAIDKNAHSYGEWEKLDGEKHMKVCAYNGAHVVTEPHTWLETERVEATATEAGYVLYTCTVCGETKRDTIAQTEAQYTVTKTVVNVDGSETTTTETFTDSIGRVITLHASDYESTGFVVDTEKSVLTGEVAANGSLELTVYVDRVKVFYTFKIGDMEYEQNQYLYGQEVIAPLTPDASYYEGYDFLGWQYEDGTLFTGETAGTQDIIITAKLEKIIDPSLAATQEELDALAAVISDELLDAVQLYYYTDEAILWVAKALGNDTTDADAFIQDAILNGYEYVGEKTSVAVNQAMEDIRALMKNDPKDPTTLNYIDSSVGYAMGVYRAESKAHVTYTTVPVKVNGTDVNASAKSLDLSAGDRVTFAFKLDTDYYVCNMNALIVYDSTLFKVVDTYGDAYDQDTIGEMFKTDLLDTAPFMALKNNKNNYEVETTSIMSPIEHYPLALRGNSEYTSRYKMLYINMSTKYEPNSKVYKFDSETNGYIANFTLEAKSGFVYDGETIAVGAIEDWYCNAAEYTLPMYTSRAAGYLNNGTTPAGFFQQGQLTKQRANPASACALADSPYSRFDQSFTSVTTFGTECAHESWTAGEITKQPTCTEPGEQTYICDNCGATESREIPALGHNYVETVIAPTCTEGGYTLHKCSRCGDEYTTDPTATIAHSWNDGVVTTAATCTTGGMMTYTCTACGATRTEATAALGHDYAETVIAPTCTEGGCTLHKCSRCGDEYTTDPTPATGHSWNSGVVTTAATCTTGGVMTYTCTACGTTKTEATAALGHDYVETVIAPTCTEGGYTLHKCSRCGDEYTTDPTAATGHSWSEGSVTKEPTCVAEGEIVYTCTRCGTTRSEAIAVDPNAHNYESVVTAPTCTEGGYTTYTCKNDPSHTYVGNETAALGHDWDDGVVTKKPTEFEEGVKTFTCRRCGETRTEAIAVLPLSELRLTASIQPEVTANDIQVTAKYGRKGRVVFKLTASTDYDDDVDVTYTCSNPKFMTVDEDGNIRLLHLRLCHKTATITARSADGREATCQVKIKLKWWQYIVFFLFGFIWF